MKLLSWCEIWRNGARLGSSGDGWRRGYDWTLNAVRMAENRPACYGTICVSAS